MSKPNCSIIQPNPPSWTCLGIEYTEKFDNVAYLNKRVFLMLAFYLSKIRLIGHCKVDEGIDLFNIPFVGLVDRFFFYLVRSMWPQTCLEVYS